MSRTPTLAGMAAIALGLSAGTGMPMPRFSIPTGSKRYPFSSTKQDRKAATRQIMVERNGFQFMNTRRAADRLTMSQVA